MATSIQRSRQENKPINITLMSTTTNSYISLASNTFDFTVKTVKDSVTTDSTSIISKTVFVTSGTLATILLTSADTDITPKKYVFDIWRSQPNGQVEQLLEGDFIIWQPVTNRI
jgi:hypothetical protein